MKKQPMERLDSQLFQPLNAEEGTLATGGAPAATNFISFLPTDGVSPDVIRDAG